MSITSGLRSGIRNGLRSGLSPEDPLANVTLDGTSGIYAPADADEWNDLLAVAELTNTPGAVWNMQEVSGNLADAVGSTTLVAGGSGMSYQQAVAGWTRDAVTFTEGGTNGFSGTIADSAGSFAMLVYVKLLATPALSRTIVEYPCVYVGSNTTPRFYADGGSLGTGGSAPGSDVHPLLLKFDATGTAIAVYTDDEKISCDFFTVSDTSLALGSNANNAAPMAVLYGAMWRGADAEMADADVRTLLETLGWTVAW